MYNVETKYQRILRTAMATAISLFLGCVVIVSLVQKEPWFIDTIEAAIKTSTKEMIGQEIDCKVVSVDLLTGSLIVENIKSADADGTWQVHCPSLTINFSVVDLVLKKFFHAHIHVDGLDLYSYMKDNELAIEHPIKLFLEAPSVIPFKLSSITFKQSKIKINHEHGAEVEIQCTSKTHIVHNIAKTSVLIHDGSGTYKEKKKLEKVSGKAYFDFNVDSKKITLDSHIAFKMLDIAESSSKAFARLSIKDGLGQFSCNSIDDRLKFAASDITLSNGIRFNFTSHMNAQLFTQVDSSVDSSGTIAYEKQQLTLQAHIKPQNLPVFQNIEELSLNVTPESENNYTCICSLNRTPLLKASVAIAQQIKLSLNSLDEYKLSDNIVLKGLSGNGIIDEQWHVTSSAKGLYLDGSKAIQNFDLLFAYDGNEIDLKARTTNLELAAFYNALRLEASMNVLENQKKLFKGSYNFQTDCFGGDIHYGAIRKFIKLQADIDISGDGSFSFEGNFNKNVVSMNIYLIDGLIRIPQTYNNIKEAYATLSFDTGIRKLLIEKCKCILNAGSIDIKNGTCFFDEKYKVSFASITALFDNCLGNWQKMFLGVFSGYLSLFYIDGAAKVSGNIMVDKGQLKNNIFSPDIQKNILLDSMRSLTQEKSNIHLDVQVATRRNAKVKTTFLETSLKTDIKISGTYNNPHVSGTLSVKKGELLFPYKPLYITEGTIYLNPDNFLESTISLSAKNSIKKYSIHLHVSGTLQSPAIAFSSSPMLQEEQIITLLLAGSQEGSLFGVMPQVLMQGLESALFSTEEGANEWLASLKKTLKSFGNIRINPTISDKQDRPIKGGIEIDFNDRLRASISNNLDLTDETSVELEYALSDDTTLRGTRDDKGNISGEVEMRWKF